MTTTMIDKKTLGAHVIRAIHDAQRRGRSVDASTIAEAIGVRKIDVREIVSQLHQEGHVDGRRMRLTFTGFAIAVSMRSCKLRDLRETVETNTRAA